MGRLHGGGRARRGLVALAAVFGSALALGVSSPAPAGAGTAGPTWAGVSPPLPTNATSTATSKIQAVSCPAPGSCVAVGVYHVGASDAIFAASLTDGTWTATQVPSPPSDDGTDTGIQNLSCPTVGWCVATGRYSNAGNFLPFASMLSGGIWSSVALPLPPAATNPSTETQDRGLSCPATGWCVSTGGYEDPSSHTQAYIDTLSAGTWTSMVAPLPPAPESDPQAVLKAVGCAAVEVCVAGGTYLTTSPALETQGFFDSLSGQSWTPTIAPVPGDAAAMPSADIESVSCAPPTYNAQTQSSSPSACVAVGSYQNSNGGQPMAWSPAGGAAVAMKVSLPADASHNPFASLTDVSCPTSGWCEAAGSYETPAFTGGLPIVATLAGNAWTTQLAPGVGASDLAGFVQTISCSWPGSCVASGLLTLSASQIALVDTEVNGVWSGNDAVLPNGPVGSTSSDPVKPTCVAGTCLVGGEFLSHPGQDLGFLATSPNLNGYQEVASDGGLFSFNVPFNGSMGGKPLNAPIVGMTVEPDNGGYYEVATDGGIFAFNAPFQGSMGGKPLNKPIVGMTFDPVTGGYYEVASDGGIFAFNAPFQGSMGGKPLDKPVVGIAFDPQTGGYYEVASDGGLFAFNAPFQGSMGGKPLNAPVVGMDFDYAAGGYYEVATDGGLFAFNAPFQGSMGGKPLNKPMVGLAFG
ncbi:MAG TPA: hypothetical protein VMP41_10220 [Acidimicrobiales bacterium]|nr:hypothetical protein [Acidimicrobiales bacterium]